MRILVAGWHGQLAHELSEVAAARPDVSAFAVARPALDLCDRPAVGRTVFGISPDVIVNTAAYTDVDSAENEPAKAFRANAEGAAGLAAQAASIGIPIIQLSTGHIFEGTTSTSYTEDDAPSPINTYGRSKLESERAVARTNAHHVILRTTWIYSAHGRNFVTRILDRARREPRIDVVDDQYGSPTYARHLATAILDVAARVVAAPHAAPWGVYHAAGAGCVSWYDVAREVFEVSRRHGGPTAEVAAIASRDYPAAAARPRNSCLDCSRLAHRFGITLPDWREGVADCVARLLSDEQRHRGARAT